MIRLHRLGKRNLRGIRPYSAAKSRTLPQLDISRIKDEYIQRAKDSKNETLNGSATAKQDLTEATRSILNNKKALYFDPANASLNLALDNKTLFTKISKDADIRMEKRFSNASKTWLREYDEVIRKFPLGKIVSKTKEKNKELLVRKELQHSLKNATISPENAGNAISTGDLVALNNDSVNLYIIVSCPTDLDSNSYTYVNSEGKIVHGPKQLIKLRFPGVIPKHLMGVIEKIVCLERKYLDMAPIGVADATFSKSEESKPQEIQKSTPKKSRDNVADNGHIESSEIGSDFIVAQASSQLLTNSDVNTYQVPIKAREIYSNALTQVSISTFEKIPEMSQKLEILHRVLQYNDDGDCLDSPRTISIFQLLRYVELLDLNMVPKLVKEPGENGEAHLFKSLRQLLSASFLNFESEGTYSRLGKMVPEDKSWKDFARKEYPVSTFMSVVLALRTQGRLWNINQQNLTNPPLSVNILPLRNVDLLEKTISYLKFENGDTKFANYLVKKLKKENAKMPEFYNEIVQIFKDYTAGNFTNDPAAETALVSVIRLVDKALKEEGLYQESPTSQTYDYSRARGFELLQMLEDPLDPLYCGWENPSNWSCSLQLPRNNVLLMSDLSADYYKFLDEALTKRRDLNELFEQNENTKESTPSIEIPKLDLFDEKFVPSSSESDLMDDFYTSDPANTIREDFGDIPIYCIDSETAHEIDDGISIETDKDNKNYIISIHVANPTSYIKPFSDICNIAFSKGSTTYLPEGPSMMLPNIVSKIAGLGDSLETRTFVVQYKVEKPAIDDYINHRNQDANFKPDQEFSSKIMNSIQSSANVKLCLASNFPKNYTYNKVNEILNDAKNINAFKSGTLNDPHASNLFKLYNISTILKDIRIMIGNGLEISIPRSSVKVDYKKENNESFKQTETGYELAISNPLNSDGNAVVSISNGEDQDDQSKSQLLVSHFMISANYAASKFASKNGIAVIHRSQEMRLNESILQNLQEMSRRKYLTNSDLSIEEVSKILSVLTSAKFQVERKPHESLGLDGYATVTSPLRRFVDMINHWKFEEFLLAKANVNVSNIKDFQLYYMGNHLQSRELINKKIQSFSSKFWEGVFFKEYLKLLKNGKIESPIVFRLLLKSNPKFGNISVHVLGFNNLKATLESTPEVINKFNSGEFRVGQILTGNFDITRLDYIEDELTFRYI